MSTTTSLIPEALALFSNLPDEAYIRLETVRLLYGMSSATIWRNSKKGLMPSPVKLSERVTAWSVKAIRDDLAAKAPNA